MTREEIEECRLRINKGNELLTNINSLTSGLAQLESDKISAIHINISCNTVTVDYPGGSSNQPVCFARIIPRLKQRIIEALAGLLREDINRWELELKDL